MNVKYNLKKTLMRPFIFLLLAAGCVPLALNVGAALLVGYYLGNLNVDIPSGSTGPALSDRSGPARVQFDSGRMTSFEGVLPGFSQAGTTYANVDLQNGYVSGTVVTPFGEALTIEELLPGLQATATGDSSFDLTMDNGSASYRYSVAMDPRAGAAGSTLLGDVAINRTSIENGVVQLQDTVQGTIQAGQEDLPPSGHPAPLPLPPAPILFDAGPDVTINAGDSIVLQATASGGQGTLAFAWQPRDSLTNPTILQPTAMPTKTTIYTLTVADELGQQAIDTIQVGVADEINDTTPETDCGSTVTTLGPEGILAEAFGATFDVTASRPELADFYLSQPFTTLTCEALVQTSPEQDHILGLIGTCDDYRRWLIDGDLPKTLVNGWYKIDGSGYVVGDGEYVKDEDAMWWNHYEGKQEFVRLAENQVRVCSRSSVDCESGLGQCSSTESCDLSFTFSPITDLPRLFSANVEENSPCGTGLLFGRGGIGDDSEGAICVSVEKPESDCLKSLQKEDGWATVGRTVVRLNPLGTLEGIEYVDWQTGEEKTISVYPNDFVEVTYTFAIRVFRTNLPELPIQCDSHGECPGWACDGTLTACQPF